MKKIIFSIILIILVLFLYGKFIEVNNFKINNYNIHSENIPDSFKDLKIVHFSDLLYESETSDKYLEDIVTNINKENPDIIIFSGDLLKADEEYTDDDMRN